MNISVNDTFTPKKQSPTCPGKAVTTPLVTIIALTGLIANSLVLRFLRKKKTTDALILFHFSLVNFIGCTVAPFLNWFDVELIGHIELNETAANLICLFNKFLFFYSFRAAFFIIILLCYNRYEVLTKFPQNIWMSYKRGRYILMLIYLIVFLYLGAIMSGYVYGFTVEKYTLCNGLLVLQDENRKGTGREVTSMVLIAETAVILYLGHVVSHHYFRRVDKHIKNHMETVKATLGQQSTVKEIRLLKNANNFRNTHLLVWFPFGVARILKGMYTDSLTAFCIYNVCYFVTYSVFVTVPIFYIVSDKRIPVPFLRNHAIRNTKPKKEIKANTQTGSSTNTTSGNNRNSNNNKENNKENNKDITNNVLTNFGIHNQAVPTSSTSPETAPEKEKQLSFKSESMKQNFTTRNSSLTLITETATAADSREIGASGKGLQSLYNGAGCSSNHTETSKAGQGATVKVSFTDENPGSSKESSYTNNHEPISQNIQRSETGIGGSTNITLARNNVIPPNRVEDAHSYNNQGMEITSFDIGITEIEQHKDGDI